MTTIYVLKCQGGKYYVGKTDTFDKRYKEHLTGEGAAWTKKYRPIGIEKVIKGDKFDENKITKQYMDKYGVDNVRGGSYCQIKLDQASVASLNRELNGTNDKCLKCGKSGHFAKYCKYKKTQKCNRCNREGHTETQCYASTYIVETDDESDEECYERKSRGSCYRCGRTSHYSNNCYAKTHLNGYDLDDDEEEEEEEEEEEDEEEEEEDDDNDFTNNTTYVYCNDDDDDPRDFDGF